MTFAQSAERLCGCFRPRAFGRMPEQVGGLDAQHLRQPVDHVDGGAVDAALERADIGAVDIRLIGQRLLRQAARAARLAQIAGEFTTEYPRQPARRPKAARPLSEVTIGPKTAPTPARAMIETTLAMASAACDSACWNSDPFGGFETARRVGPEGQASFGRRCRPKVPSRYG